ncbi:peptidase M48 [Parasedimentitalea maritima]|uniref:Peptidase M48 n=1 Tax=Parasedimentitalea maritima TaxID=2578117 RepID=A0ABY2UXD3_9RHOB|nr:peptidase M48 [Zongyanglinia marina]
MRRLLLLLLFAVGGCEVYTPPFPGEQVRSGESGKNLGDMTPHEVGTAFATVAHAVNLAAEQECRARTKGVNCDFLIHIDRNPDAPANAYQSLSRSGRPVITFTRAMLADLENRDELAFVMSHEAAHHIRGHLRRQHENAVSGAIIFAGLATAAGASAGEIAEAQDLGALVGARSYSKEFELEADELGTIITHQSGYSPSIGVLFFNRLPDPGDRFLGTHPSNHDRVKVVHRTIALTPGLN